MSKKAAIEAFSFKAWIVFYKQQVAPEPVMVRFYLKAPVFSTYSFEHPVVRHSGDGVHQEKGKDHIT